MAALPSPSQVAGPHNAIYEAYYHQVDPNGTGAIQALDAARFLKKSRLSDVVLSKIWDLSDPNGKGYLDKPGLFVALKLVALAQAGKDINMSNIYTEAPPPKVGEVPAPTSLPPARPAPVSDWGMKQTDRDKYNQLFDSLQPANGLIPGNKVKGVLMESKLPLDTLGRIWDLADQDKDGMLDRHEFMVAMHLVYKALEKHAVPSSLPPSLHRPPPARPPSRPPSRPVSPARPPPLRPQPPSQIPQSNAMLLEELLDFSGPVSSQPPPSTNSWVVSVAEQNEFRQWFLAADKDRDGLVSGAEIKDKFLESGLPQATLAHIWSLCDIGSRGKLSLGEFCLAMWLVRGAQGGSPPPPALAPHMLPPELPRTLDGPVAPTPPLEPALNLGPQPTPELEAIAREVDALARERLALEAEVATKERDLAQQNAEANSLQSELDTLTATLKQLENQKGEAQKRLNDLKAQVDKLRSQVSAQESAGRQTEAEVAARRAAATSLREREAALLLQQRELDTALQDVTHRLSDTVLLISQANIKLSHLEEHHETLESAVTGFEKGVPRLDLQPQYQLEHLHSLVRGTTPHDALEDSSFPKSNGFGSMNGGGFTSDPFQDTGFNNTQSHDPFANTQAGFTSDPFASSNPDPFSGDSFVSGSNTDNNTNNNDDPFAVLHAPTLPPKRHRTPPPRPAPPRPTPPAQRPATALEFTEDPFKDYRYEDPFNINDPFSDVTDSKNTFDAFGKSTSLSGFGDDIFGMTNGNSSHSGHSSNSKPSGRVSAPPIAYDPFSKSEFKANLTTISSNNNDSWAAWPNDNWATDEAWDKPKNDAWTGNTKQNDTWSNKTDNWSSKTDKWSSKTDNWATDWGQPSPDLNKNHNETWPNTLPSKKEKSPKPVKYAKSLVHTIGGIGRTKQKDKEKKSKSSSSIAKNTEVLPSEEQQWAWAAEESKRLQIEAEIRRRQEDAELQLALAISKQEK